MDCSTAVHQIPKAIFCMHSRRPKLRYLLAWRTKRELLIHGMKGHIFLGSDPILLEALLELLTNETPMIMSVNLEFHQRTTPGTAARISVADNTWYGVTLKYVAGQPTVYDSSLILVGSATWNSGFNSSVDFILLETTRMKPRKVSRPVWITLWRTTQLQRSPFCQCRRIPHLHRFQPSLRPRLFPHRKLICHGAYPPILRMHPRQSVTTSIAAAQNCDYRAGCNSLLRYRLSSINHV